MGRIKKQKMKGSQTDPFMEKMNAGLNKLIVLFYIAGAAVYLTSELIKAKNKSKI